MGATPGFIFGGNTGETPQSLAAKRAVADSLATRGGAPRNVGEGLTSVGDALASAVMNYRINKDEAAGRASANDAFAPLLASMGGGAAGASPNISAVAAALSNPFATDGQKAVAQALLSRSMQQQDPEYQMRLKTQQAQLDQAQHPRPEYGFTALPDGTVLRTDKSGGTASPVYQGAGSKPASVQEFEYGQAHPGFNEFKAASGTNANQTFDNVSGVRKEIQGLPSYKTYQNAVPSFNSMVDNFDKTTKASDLDFVYAMAKIYDPTSVVREGEQVLVNKTASLPDQFLGLIGQVNGGQALQPDTRRALIDAARTRVNEYRAALDTDFKFYGDIADRYKFNRADIIPQLVDPRALPPTPTVSAPPVASPPMPTQAAPAATPPANALYPMTGSPGTPYTINQAGNPAGQMRADPRAMSGQAAPARITSDAEFAALPSGALFVGPDGQQRRKP